MTEISEKLETIEALKPAIEEMKAEKGELAETVFAELLAKQKKLLDARTFTDFPTTSATQVCD